MQITASRTSPKKNSAPKRVKKEQSEIWKYWTKDGDYAACKFCSKKLSIASGGFQKLIAKAFPEYWKTHC
jgi:hypothetical protein